MTDELRGANSKLQVAIALVEEYVKRMSIGAMDDALETVLAAARQAAESLGPAPEREQWANNVANLIQLGAHDGESLSAELHRMEKVLLTYYPRAETEAARLQAIEEMGVLLADYEIETGQTHPGMFKKLSKLRAAIRQPAPTISEAGAPRCFAVAYSNYIPVEVDSLWATREGAESRRKELSERDPWEIIEMEIRKPEAGAEEGGK
jgi:hypothetical protein